jgi:membrane protein implicated in regulation of membrane protease activity
MFEIVGTWWAWVILAIALFLGELLIIGFYLIPLGAAALIAALGAFLSPLPASPYGWLVPCVVFIVTSPILMVTIRPLMVKLMYTGGRRLNLDALVGHDARVTESIDSVSGKGQVRIDRESWAASSADGQPIPAGTVVDVLEIRGNRAIVKHKG